MEVSGSLQREQEREGRGRGRGVTLRLSGSSDRPAYPGFMVMATKQLGLRRSSVPSKSKYSSFN